MCNIDKRQPTSKLEFLDCCQPNIHIVTKSHTPICSFVSAHVYTYSYHESYTYSICSFDSVHVYSAVFPNVIKPTNELSGDLTALDIDNKR